MPSVKSVHVDAPLTNVAVQYKNSALVGEKVLPVVTVVKESDKYYIFKKEELNLDLKRIKRAAGAEALEIKWDVDTATYSADEYAVRYLLPDRVVNNADVAVQPRINTTKKLTNKILNSVEREVAQLVQNTNNVTSNAQPGVLWNASSGVVIEDNIDTAKNTIRKLIGIEPTSICLPYDVAQVVKTDSTLRDLIRYTVNGMGGKELLMNGGLPPVLFNLEVIIAGAIYNTANEGATESLDDIWEDNVLIFYKENAPSIDSLSLGYQFRVANLETRSWREEKRKGEMVEVNMLQDEKIVAADCGYVIKSPLG